MFEQEERGILPNAIEHHEESLQAEPLKQKISF